METFVQAHEAAIRLGFFLGIFAVMALWEVARNLPLEDLADRLDELGEDPERTIAIVCRTDRRSAKAAALLARRGFADVHVVRGGMTAWLEHGWPTERGPELTDSLR